MKERIAGAVLMLVVAVTMVVSATFAWITISTSPEVSGTATTVAANGNLEIALAHDNGREMPSSGRGDSSAVDSDLQRANITWGNLVNLSDPDYGLASITLRPASLTGTTGLLNNPLYGVTYGADGRVVKSTSDDDFAYSYYIPEYETFSVDIGSNHYGVRAISTVTYTNISGDNTLAELKSLYSQSLNTAKNGYSKMTDQTGEPGRSYINSIQGLIQVYAQAQIDKNLSNTPVTDYVPDLYNMMVYLDENVVSPLESAYINLARICYLKENGNIDNFDAEYNIDTLCSQAIAGTLPAYIKNDLPSLVKFAQDRKTLRSYEVPTNTSGLAYWANLANNGTDVYWRNISGVIGWIVEIDTATLDGYNMSQISGIGTALAILGKSNHLALIYGGALYRMEYRIGQYMSPSVTVTVDPAGLGGAAALVGKKTLTAVVNTNAKTQGEIEMANDLNSAIAGAGNYKGTDPVAEDTYAMAIDLWVRTNSGPARGSQSQTTTSTDPEGNEVVTVVSPEQAYLTLEGNLITKEVQEEKTVNVSSSENRNISSGSYPVYAAKITLEGEESSLEVYKADNQYWTLTQILSFPAHSSVSSLAGLAGINYDDITFSPQIETKTVVIGYDGVNRVWSDEQMQAYKVSGGTSTTMGSGSCYVFYASNEADQTRFLQLLNAMKVVFINGNGRMIGRADMDTEHFYAENGKVTVPLVLDKSQAISLGTNVDGKDIYGLMPLEKNVATRVTALIYLDGTSLSNTMVLASGDIQGNLNLQFGSATASTVITTTTEEDEEGGTISRTDTGYTTPGSLTPAVNPDLMEDFVSVSASAAPTEFEFNASAPSTTQVRVNVDGTTPNSVAIRFTRAINSTQGVLQQMVTLTKNGNAWTGDYSFNKPGNYVLRTVFVDGVEYDLPEAINVTVVGSTVTSLSCDAISGGTYAAVLSADSRFTTRMIMGFSTSHAQPRTVRGIFLDENGRQVTVVFSSAGSGNWTGTAAFTSSGTYTMKYVEIDGDQYELASNLQPTLELILGLRVRTWVTASPETLAKLQAIDEGATPTKFTLDTAAKDEEGNVLLNITGDPGDDVTLLVSAALYDNANNLVTGFPDAAIVYGKSGSSTKKLDANMTWNSSINRYEGEFLVTEAGTYKFTRMTVGTNVITSYSTAPNIQALPPEDAYYFNNYTPDYQFAPGGDAAAVIGLAYSNAATRVTGVFTNSSGTTIETDAALGGEAEDQGDKTVNLWYIPIPVVNGTQDGTWTLNTVKMYGVYYNGLYYDEENPAEIDLAAQHISTKVVNTIYTTLGGTSTNYNGTFMADHNSDFSVTIKDYEGEDLRNVDISDVKVKYYINAADVDPKYGYQTASGLVDYYVESVAAPQSDGSYKATINFQVAGLYEVGEVSVIIDGKTYREANMEMRYTDGGAVKEQEPKFTVTWTQPTIRITGSSPSKGSNFDINTASGSSLSAVTVQNYYDDYYANVYAQVNTLFGYPTGYTLPKLTFTLSGAGDKLGSNGISMDFAIPNLAYPSHAAKVLSFTANNSAKQTEIGDLDGNTRNLATNSTHPKIVISTIEGKYGNMTFELPLTHDITIKEPNSAPLTVTYVVPLEYQDQVNTPAVDKTNKGTITLPTPSKTEWTVTEDVPGEMSPETVSSTTQNVYTSRTDGTGCNAKSYHTNYVRTVKTYTSSGTAETRRNTYRVIGWKVGNVTYQPGDTLNYTANTTVTLVVEEVSSEIISTKTSTRTRITYTDVQNGNEASGASGTGTKVDQVYTTETEISDVYS